jgi:hypothetical protein
VPVEAGVTVTAPFKSILFDCPPDVGERDDPPMFTDLNLDQVFAAVTVGGDEYDLMPFFRSPLRDVRAVDYRDQDEHHRGPDQGRRPAAVLTTSYVRDLYRQVFGTADTETRV